MIFLDKESMNMVKARALDAGVARWVALQAMLDEGWTVVETMIENVSKLVAPVE